MVFSGLHQFYVHMEYNGHFYKYSIVESIECVKKSSIKYMHAFLQICT